MKYATKLKKKCTVRQCDDAGVLELVRYVGCLSLAIGLASAHARVYGTASPAEENPAQNER